VDTKYDVITPHMHCFNNCQSISLSKNCVCIYCKQTFPKDSVIDWVETETEKTAICPFCGIDAVIGDATNAPIADSEFIEAIHQHWF
jgi:hypothetical protein